MLGDSSLFTAIHIRLPLNFTVVLKTPRHHNSIYIQCHASSVSDSLNNQPAILCNYHSNLSRLLEFSTTFGQGEGTQPDTGSCQLHSLHWHYPATKRMP